MKQIVTINLLTLLLSACTAIPTKNNPDAYTRSIVQDAIRRYRQHGRQAVIDYYSSADNVDGQWYVFIIDENGRGLAHHNPERIGQDASGATDVTGYNYGKEFVSATEQGHWVSYMYVNPETNEQVRKHTWVILYDGLTFCSGWYEGDCIVGAFRPVGIRCTHFARARDRAGQELSDGGRGHASGGSVNCADQTKQRDGGASDGLPTRQRGRDIIGAWPIIPAHPALHFAMSFPIRRQR